MTDDLKSDSGVLIAVDAGRAELRLSTTAGPVTYKVAPEPPVFGADGKPAGSVADLKAGQRVRVYYLIKKDGPHLNEVDLL